MPITTGSMPDDLNVPPGTAEHAELIAGHRHPGIRDGLQWLTYAHLPPALQPYSAPFYSAAVALLNAITTDGPELTTAINRLTDAKDSAVRAGVRHTTGRAGSVPRPQAVVHPPRLADTGQ
ncbi:hypothetical protein [Verrucosispora sp. WMMC514]|uniref:hypothetical protein n=1 Tax=Verrucosispora sp. WMMC514 TaxID=3015156 RepID=UPI00248B0BEC|nr:hypothetical protein [Verrucosispora sp. WMMC514]WBB94211.1 hypothetical protein O7597_15280 [Verrucosispora sp. WMMC514]